MHKEFRYVNIPQKSKNQKTNEEVRKQKVKVLLSPIKAKGLRVDPVRGSAQGTKGELSDTNLKTFRGRF